MKFDELKCNSRVVFATGLTFRCGAHLRTLHTQVDT